MESKRHIEETNKMMQQLSRAGRCFILMGVKQPIVNFCLRQFICSINIQTKFNNQYVQQMEDGLADFKAWYFTKPIFTRTYLSICTVLTLLITLQLVNPMILLYTFDATFFKFQLWRPFTAMVFMGRFNFSFIFNAYFAYIAISKVETQVFVKQKFHDFLWLVIMLFIGCIIVGSLFTIMVFTEVFLMALIYIWCKRMPHQQIRILFGVVVKTGYFPFVYAIMMTLFGGNLWNYFFGILLGHGYIFVKDIAFARYHKDYLPTPRWFVRWWYGRDNVDPRQRNNPAGPFAGRGVRMG